MLRFSFLSVPVARSVGTVFNKWVKAFCWNRRGGADLEKRRQEDLGLVVVVVVRFEVARLHTTLSALLGKEKVEIAGSRVNTQHLPALLVCV